MSQITIGPCMAVLTAGTYIAARHFDYQPLLSIALAWAAFLPLYLGVWSSWIYPYYVSDLRHVPTVEGCPLWGQFFDIIREECGVPQRRWHQQYGSIIRYFFPFGAERLSIADDDALKHMTVRNPYNYPKPVRAKLWMVRILGEGVLLAEGPEHAHQRKSLAPGFSTQSIRSLLPVFWSKGTQVASKWRDEMASKNLTTTTIEVLEWLNRTTLDIIGQAGFGYNINSIDQPETSIRQAYRLVFAFDIWSRILHGVQAFVPASKYIPAKMNRDMQESHDIIVDKATEIIKEKLSEPDDNVKSNDIMALIARDNKKLQEAGEKGLSFETMRDQIMTFLGAGHDTTATGLAWTLHLLSKNPDMQSKLRDEIREYFPFLFNDNESSTELSTDNANADPDQLPYLDNVCRESLRYIPPIPMTVRQSRADDNLGGYHVPGGTVVYILANAINRLPQYWGETADQFDPDRWDDLPSTYTNNAYMTFLQGPRGCIGRKFAETEMKVLLCCLLSKFDFQPDESVDDPEMWKMWRLVLRPKDGVSLRVRPVAN